jgi:hypothetical protein
MRTLSSGPAGPEADTSVIGVHRLATEAIARLSPLWPDITSAV